ncbi:single-stranded DNA-binding protein [Leucobacter ruminantium]|uniref:Single-stranded DNA-binding protein n=1 Tax=Leucobacter ruminantium TaxID=1289170 RepID=A0A939LZB2_9MICO|nr:single-stranded DNA-binding protein [Leucobacter ruminantium]MBO1805863.1 single-stranded DNA-binding protein [Leucobacter ruminantium]
MAGEPIVTVVGNLVADPEPRVSQAGKPWVTFRIASTPRVRDRQTGDWSDGEPLWLGCRAYGEYADNIAASLTKGMRVIVTGRLSQRSYTDKNGEQRTSLDLEVEEVGPSLRFATAAVSRAGSGPAGGGYAKTGNGQQPSYGSTEGGGYSDTNPWAQGAQSGAQGASGFDNEQPF